MVLLLIMLVHSWKARGRAVVCRYEVFHLRQLHRIGQRPAVLIQEVCLYTAAHRMPTRHRRPQLRNQVGDIVRIRTALCMLRLLPLLVVRGAHRFCTIALCYCRISSCNKLGVASPPYFHGSLPISRPILQLCDYAKITRDFRHNCSQSIARFVLRWLNN